MTRRLPKAASAWIAAVLLCLQGLAYAAPATVVQTVTYDGETITMRLTKENLRGSAFELWSQNAAGTYDTVTPVDERSYMGSVDGYPGAVSCGILLDSGLFKGAVYFDRGVTWFTLDTSVVETRALDYGSFSNFQTPGSSSVTPGQAGSNMTAFNLGIDVDYDYFNTTSGGSTATALEGIEYSVCLVRAIYMRDALLRPYLGRVIIRSTLAHDPYTGLTQGTYLDAVRTEWNDNHTDTDHDLAAGVSPTKIGGGLAWVGVVGTSSGYSVNQCNSSGNFDVVFRHEMGHNWGCGHFVGGSPEGAGLMGGNAPGRFSSCETHNVLNQRDSRLTSGGILVDEGVYTAIELPPYASLDTGTFTQTADTTITIDVLANDHDANDQAISLVSFDATSAQGGTVTQQGQDLVYAAPGAYLGTDYFLYKITDTAGRTATGVATISVQPNDTLRLYLPLDETTGTSAADTSVFARTASLQNGALPGSTGKFVNAVTMDGIDDRITVDDLNVNSDTVTLAAWIKRPATDQNSFSGIIFNRAQNAAGLNFGSANELRYHWDGSNWNWNSGLVPPVDQWTFVALVIEPTQATIYMHDGTLQSAVRTTTHSAQSFAGTTEIGRDPNSSSRSFLGDMDDVRVYARALSQAEILDLVAGGAAESPSPFDGAIGVSSQLASWAPGASATNYEVFLGTDESAVAAANSGSPEFQGTTTDAEWTFALETSTQYYWRVDTVTPSGTVTGNVWDFSTASEVFEPGLIAHWKFDDAAGSTAIDSSSNTNSGTLDGANWSTGFDGGGLTFDGADDSVTFGTGPSLSGTTDLTVSAWIKTSASSDQVILQQRNGGFNGQYAFRVLANGTLSFYIYGDSGYQYNFSTSTTVNDGQWHFVTAVRDGDNGYIYLDGNPTPAASANGTARNLNSSIGVGVGRDIRDDNKPFNGMIDEVKIYDLAKSGAQQADAYAAYTTPTNQAPVWDSNPVAESDAVEGIAYSASLAGQASDPDSDPLDFSKVSGPTWLTVGTDGSLSGTPSSGDLGVNQWTVSVDDGTAPPVEVFLNLTVLADSDGDGDPDSSDPDDDNDEIPDDWEIAHSLDPLVDDADEDPDGDGKVNRAEYVADTDPQDEGSMLTLTNGPSPETGEPTLTFSTSPNRLYTVQYRDLLHTGGWMDLGPAIPGTGAEESVPDPSAPAWRFYQLRVELP